MRWSTAWNSTNRLMQRAHEHRLFRAPIGKPFEILVFSQIPKGLRVLETVCPTPRYACGTARRAA